jgi:hypothetical protein
MEPQQFRNRHIQFTRQDGTNMKALRFDMIKGYSNLSEHMLHWLSEEAAKAGIRVVIDQWERNGSPDLVATGISGFAHLPTRKMSDADIQFAKEHNIFFITTLVVTESFARSRLNATAFLQEPYITDTTPPWFLTELAEYAQKTQTAAEKKGLGYFSFYNWSAWRLPVSISSRRQ